MDERLEDDDDDKQMNAAKTAAIRSKVRTTIFNCYDVDTVGVNPSPIVRVRAHPRSCDVVPCWQTLRCASKVLSKGKRHSNF
jgi:hypothetical protein